MTMQKEEVATLRQIGARNDSFSWCLRGGKAKNVVEKGVKRDGVPLFIIFPLSFLRRGGLRG
jgi:hypothetical protein